VPTSNPVAGELAIGFQHDHGRPPIPVEALHLAHQATLETRDAKHEPRSLAEQRATWLNEAAAVLGGRGAVASMVQAALTPAAETATIANSHWVAQAAGRILTVMEASRSTWQMWHVRADAQRHVRTIDVTADHSMRCWIAGFLLSPRGPGQRLHLHRTARTLVISGEGDLEKRAPCGRHTARRSST
jgi:hypothetical protein